MTNHTHSPESRIVVSAVDVVKKFGEIKALDNVSLDVAAGTVTCIIGPSGSGKSTFLRCINQLEKIDGGAIWVNDALVGYRQLGDKLYQLNSRAIAHQRSKIGMVFQRFNLFPHMTVLQNIVEAPLRVRRESIDVVGQRAISLLERVGLAHRRDAYPGQLSGGQQQRVAIARALAMEPTLMLFDEPTSALDPELVGEVLSVMKDLAVGGTTMIVVTHELAFAREVGNSVAFMADGQIVEFGSAEQVLLDPIEERTKAFISAVR